MSKVWGSGHTSGSKLAAARLVATSVPAGNRTSRYSMSSDGDAGGAAHGAEVAHRLLDRLRCELGLLGEQRPLVGVLGEERDAQASWLRVVSVPAMSTASVIITSSSVDSRSPASSAAIRSLSRSSAGCERRSSIIARTYSSSSSDAVLIFSASFTMSLLKMRKMSVAQPRRASSPPSARRAARR